MVASMAHAAEVGREVDGVVATVAVMDTGVPGADGDIKDSKVATMLVLVAVLVNAPLTLRLIVVLVKRAAQLAEFENSRWKWESWLMAKRAQHDLVHPCIVPLHL